MLPAVMTLPVDLAADFDLLKDAVSEAGEIAEHYFGRKVDIWEKKPGHPVSEADLAVNDHLIVRLRDARPEYAWLSEEDPDSVVRLDAARLWIVDPIDGTRAFLKGRKEYSVTVALIEGSRPVLGVVYSPSTDEFYAAAVGAGASLNGRRVQATASQTMTGAHLLVSRSEMQKRRWNTVFDDCTVTAISSVAYKMARVAAGQADAVLSLWPKSDWDLAAGDLLIREAGGRVATPDGAELVYNRERPRHPGIIAGGTLLFDRLRARIETL